MVNLTVHFSTKLTILLPFAREQPADILSDKGIDKQTSSASVTLARKMASINTIEDEAQLQKMVRRANLS